MDYLELIKLILPFITGGIFGVMIKYWFDYKGMVYKELWIKRYETYKKMFCLTGFLPLYPQKAAVSYQDLFLQSQQMRDWFFNEGGMLLSTKTRNKYFQIQENISLILKEKLTEAPDDKITKEYESLRKLFSQLRRAMTDDLMSRGRI